MRIERRGPVEPLTRMIERFIHEGLCGVALDTPDMAEDQRPDWTCLKGVLALEVKTLEEDGEERMENLNEKFRQRDDWPLFYGKAPLNKVLAHTSEPEKLNREALDRTGRPIRTHLKKANKQLLAHETRVRRKNLVRVAWLINEDHAIYDPNSTAYVIAKSLRRDGSDNGPLTGIDAVLYVTHRHAQTIRGRTAFPIVIVFGPGIAGESWKQAIVQEIVRRWAEWQGIPYFKMEPRLDQFSTIEPVPDKMKRHELWRLQYRREPYLSGLTDARLRDRFDEIIVLQTLASVNGSPWRPPNAVQLMEPFTHILEEINHRGLPMTAFEAERNRFVAAATRLRLPQIAIEWVSATMSPRAA